MCQLWFPENCSSGLGTWNLHGIHIAFICPYLASQVGEKRDNEIMWNSRKRLFVHLHTSDCDWETSRKKHNELVQHSAALQCVATQACTSCDPGGFPEFAEFLDSPCNCPLCLLGCKILAMIFVKDGRHVLKLGVFSNAWFESCIHAQCKLDNFEYRIAFWTFDFKH